MEQQFFQKFKNLISIEQCNFEDFNNSGKVKFTSPEELYYTATHQPFSFDDIFKPVFAGTGIKNSKIIGYRSISTNGGSFVMVDNHGNLFATTSTNDDDKIINYEYCIECDKNTPNALSNKQQNAKTKPKILMATCNNYMFSYINSNQDLYINNWKLEKRVSKNVQHVSLGKRHMCFISDSDLYLYGENKYGQLGIYELKATKPYKLTSNVTNVVCGDHHTLYLNSNDELFVSGKNNKGQLGTGNFEMRSKFVKIATNASKIYAKYNMSAVISKSDILFVCGDNSDGQLSFDDDKYPKINVLTVTYENVKFVTFGKESMSIISNDDKLYHVGYFDGYVYIDAIKIFENIKDVAIDTDIKFGIGWDQESLDEFTKLCN